LYISPCIHLATLVSCIYKKNKKNSKNSKRKKINFSFKQIRFLLLIQKKSKKISKMAEFPNEFYNSYENQYNPYENQYNQFDFTSNSYGYFNDNYCVNKSNWAPQNFQNNDEPIALDKQLESLLESSTQQNQKLSELCSSYKCNNSSKEFQIPSQNFQNQHSTFKTRIKSLLEPITQQKNIDLYCTFTSDNSSQGFQFNQNSNSSQNCQHFDYNHCQNNFDFQNDFQNQNQNVNHFLNNFDNGNSFNNDAFDSFCSQHFQNENSQIQNPGFDLTEREYENFLLGTLNKVRNKQNQIQICDEPRNYPPFTEIDDFQTTFEIEDNILNKVVENTVIELDFNSFESVESNLKFDLPFPDFEILNTTTLDFEIEKHLEVVENSIKEDELNEHEFFGWCDKECESEEETYSSCEESERKHDLEFLDNLEMSINLANQLVYDHKFLKGYNDKFLDHMYKLFKEILMERIRVRNTLEINLLEFKPRFKPSYDNILLFKANSNHSDQNKCVGNKGGRKSQFIHHLHKSHFVFETFLYIFVKLHILLNIILHLIHLWVLSSKF